VRLCSESPPWAPQLRVRPSVLSLGLWYLRLAFASVLTPAVSSLGPSCCHCAVRVVVRPSTRSLPVVPSFGPLGWCWPLRCRCWARGTLVWPFALALTPAVSSFDPSCCRCAARVVIGPAVRWMGPSRWGWPPLCRPSALRAAAGLFESFFGPPRGRWACATVVGPFALLFAPAVSSFGSSCCRWAVRVGVDPAVSSFGPSYRGSAVRVGLTPPCRRLARRRRPSAFHAVVQPAGSSFFRSCCRVACPVGVHPLHAVRVVLSSGLEVSGGEGRGKGENELRLPSRLVLVTHWLGLPFPGSPLCLLLPLRVVLH